MASPGRKRALFWQVNTITVYTMAAGAAAWAVGDAAAAALGTGSVFRSVAGTAVFLAVFAGIGFVVSLATYGWLLQHYAVTPAPEHRADPGAGS
jgi:hypothetical protein